jgi:hypothetical protein
VTYIFRWSGQYFGFLDGGFLYDAAGNYIGWVAGDGNVFRADGSYLGELVEDEYVLRSPFATVPANRPPMSPPMTPTLPVPPTNRPPRAQRPGYADALDAY